MNPSQPAKPVTTVVITAEGLATAAISCYGSSWNPTPEIDAIASRGCVWDRLLATSTNPLDVLARWVGTSDESWLAAVSEVGAVELFTDDARLAKQGFALRLDRVELVSERSLRPRTRPYERIEQTRMGRLIASAMDRLDQPNPPSVLWIHTSSLVSTWDAPRFLAVADDDEVDDDSPSDEVELIGHPSDCEPLPEKPPAVFDTTAPPSLELASDMHPDLAMSWMRTYGCQVRLFDLLVGLVRDFEPLEGAKLVIAGTSGFALGENGWIGAQDGPIRSNRIRLPLIMSEPASLRVPHLLSSDDVNGLLEKLISGTHPVVTASEWVQTQTELVPRIHTRNSDGTQLTNTPGWFLAEEPSGELQLFLKPDDVADINNVARLRDDVASQLSYGDPTLI